MLTATQDESRYDNRTKTHIKEGFTLVEIIIAFGLIAVIIGILYPVIRGQFEKANTRATETQIRNIRTALDSYYEDIGEYPSKLEDLIKRPTGKPEYENWQTGGYLKPEPGKSSETLFKDPWKRKYQYQRTESSEHPYELYSYGPNGPKSPKIEHIRAKF